MESLHALRIELGPNFHGRSALSLADQVSLSELSQANRVVLSLAKVEEIDEAGLAMLVRLYSQLRIRGAQLQLEDAPPFVRALLDRIGFGHLISYGERFANSAVDTPERVAASRVEA